MSVLVTSDVAAALGVGLGDVAAMADRREVVSVTTWAGEMVYPEFQFHGGTVCPIVARVLRDIAAKPCAATGMRPDRWVGLHGWSLALFLDHVLRGHRHGVELDHAGTIEELLRSTTLWRPQLAAARTGTLDGINGSKRTTIAAGRTMHRVTRVGWNPCYFSAYTRDPVSGEIPLETGRLDLPASSGEGTWYLGDRETGVWREVLDQYPVVTLEEILTKQRVELAPKVRVGGIVDVTGGGARLTAVHRRATTLHVARRLRIDDNAAGVKYSLSKERRANGFALFGTAGEQDLRATDHGEWDQKGRAIPALQDPHLWTVLKWREDNDPLPIVLKRFPPTPPPAP
ncbi:MAG: hypothetical protein LBK59_01415 [Bifidobacteriaceae bacterium]|nr:hypothetical protein [Bifidobacteriaceae bacterium]